MGIGVDNPYASDGSWLRGNLHAHSTFSDGSEPFEDVLADYERRGYDFLGVTDHDIFIDPDEYRERTSLTLIPAVEVSRNGPHLLQLDAKGFIEPDRDRKVNHGVSIGVDSIGSHIGDQFFEVCEFIGLKPSKPFVLPPQHESIDVDRNEQEA